MLAVRCAFVAVGGPSGGTGAAPFENICKVSTPLPAVEPCGNREGFNLTSEAQAHITSIFKTL